MLFTQWHDPYYIQAYLIYKTNSEQLKNSNKDDNENEKETMAEMEEQRDIQNNRKTRRFLLQVLGCLVFEVRITASCIFMSRGV